MSVVTTLARNMLSSYAGFIGSLVIAFLLSPFLVHSLGDTGYGIWTIIAALTGYMALLDMGISSAVAKYVAQYHRSGDRLALRRVMSSAVLLTAAITGLLILCSPMIAAAAVHYFTFDPLYTDTLYTLIIVAVVDMAVFVVSGVFVGAMIGFQRFDILTGVRLLAQIVKALLFYVLISNGHGLLTMGIVSLCVNLAIGLTLYQFACRLHGGIGLSPKLVSRQSCRTIVGYSKFTFIAMLALQITYYSDAFVIGIYMSAAAVTYYSIAWSLHEYSAGMIAALSHSFFPAFSEQQAGEDREAMRRTFLSGTRMILVISNLVCVGMLALGDRFIALWMGDRYSLEATPVLLILFASLLIKNPQTIGTALLLGTANYRIFAWTSLVFAFFNLGLNILLVQDYGLVGVAAGTAITQGIFYGLVTPWLTTRVAGISLRWYLTTTYLRAAPSAVFLFAVLSFLKATFVVDGYIVLLAQASLGSVLYLGFVYLWQLDVEERAFVCRQVLKLRTRLPLSSRGPG